jgi:outer membrane protein assembly factor BamB
VTRSVEWKAGAGYMGGTAQRDGGRKILRSIDIQIGDVKWELPQTGPANSWGGVLATAGGIVAVLRRRSIFTAADARTGKRLWQWPAEPVWRSSPMTYTFDSKQYIAIAAGSNVVSFGLAVIASYCLSPIRFSNSWYSRIFVFSREPEMSISSSVNVPAATLWNGFPPFAFTSGSSGASCRTKK